jgi:hypothetical protein
MKLINKEKYTLKDIERIEQFRNAIMDFEKKIVEAPGSYGDPNNPGQDEIANRINPLKHTFSDGLYIREIFMPKGQLITTGIHKQEHAYFVQKGKVRVLTENGMQHIQAPHNGITKPGTKRVIYTEEDTIWITVHATRKKTVKTVLKQIVAKDFDDPQISIETMKKNLQIKNK